jgi:predicted transcriptional regulator
LNDLNQPQPPYQIAKWFKTDPIFAPAVDVVVRVRSNVITYLLRAPDQRIYIVFIKLIGKGSTTKIISSRHYLISKSPPTHLTFFLTKIKLQINTQKQKTPTPERRGRNQKQIQGGGTMQLQNNKNFSQSQIHQYHLPFQPNRKYFTATPNMILDHPELDIYDAMLYIHIKRIAGENGQCWASIRYLAGKMKVSKSQVQKSLQKLLKLGLIRHAGTRKIKTRPRNVYEIVDIWEMNVNYYSNRQNNTSETIENQEEVIHNHNNGDCPQYGQTQKDCPPYGQTQTAKPNKSIENQKLKRKNFKPKKNHIKEEKPKSSSSRKNDDDVDNSIKPQPAQKEIITKGEGSLSLAQNVAHSQKLT